MPPSLASSLNLGIADSISSINFTCRLSRESVLCFGPLTHALSPQDNIEINGTPARKPYIGTILQEGNNVSTLMLLTPDQPTPITHLQEVTIRTEAKQVKWLPDSSKDLNTLFTEFPKFLKQFSPKNIKKILFNFYQMLSFDGRLSGDLYFCTLTYLLRNELKEVDASIARCRWLLPNVLFIDGTISAPPKESLKLLVTSPKYAVSATVEAQFFNKPKAGPRQKRFLGLCLFEEPVEEPESAMLTLVTSKQLLPLAGQIPLYEQETSRRAVLTLLESFNETSRLMLREHIAQVLRKFSRHTNKKLTHDLLLSMQQFVTAAPRSYVRKDQPFAMQVEHSIPVGNKGVLLSGWMRDPLSLLDSVDVISDLGITLKAQDQFTYYDRPEIDDQFNETPFGGVRCAKGFVAYIPLKEEDSEALEGLANLDNFRIIVNLKGGVEQVLIPQRMLNDPFSLRDTVLQKIGPRVVENKQALEPLRKAAAELQQHCMWDIKMKAIHRFGRTDRPKGLKKPIVAVVIPLYKNLEFVRAQIAHFSNDKFMENAEIIYVLDSPEQEAQAIRLFEDHCALYRVPVSLLVMSRNYGYAAASNAGASMSDAEYLLLMNSDVLPISYGWLAQMLDYYMRTQDVGVLGCKLLYPDESLQHAGIFFAQSGNSEQYENRHFYKGFPKTYPAANISRSVPAVTGACMLTSKKIFDKVKGLSTRYIVGDFEDTDFCLKVLKQGKSTEYLASVELYHLERQSIGQTESSAAKSTYALNAALHHDQWKDTMQKLMAENDRVLLLEEETTHEPA